MIRPIKSLSLVSLAMAVLLSTPPAGSAQDPGLETARRILATTPLIDGHNDLPWAIRNHEPAPRSVVAYDLRQRTPGHTDIERLRQGMVGGQFWSVYVACDALEAGEAVTVQAEQIDIVRQLFRRYPDVLQQASTASDVERSFGQGRIASLLGMEGGHAIDSSLGTLRAFYDLGVRYMTLTHNCHTAWADAANEPPLHEGLNEFGVEVVREMNRMGMLVDLSHTSPATMHDALDVSRAPVIWSHASARALVDHVRNVPDDVLQRLPANGGVVMVTFVPSFVSPAVDAWVRRQDEVRRELQDRFGEDDPRVQEEIEAWEAENPSPRATMDDVIAHIEHIRDVAGIDHVAIGGDFDGITVVVDGLEDVSTYPDLFAALVGRGWSEEELRKLAGDNILRAMREAEEAARVLQRTTDPSTARLGPGAGGG